MPRLPARRSRLRGCALRRITYCTVTRSVASSASTLTASTTIRSPSHCCSAPCTSICVVAASTSLLGANTSCKQAAAEVRPHDPLAGAGEQHLINQIANVIRVVGLPPFGRGYRSERESRCWP